MIGASAHCAEGYCAEILVYRAEAAIYIFRAPSTASRSGRTKGIGDCRAKARLTSENYTNPSLASEVVFIRL